MGAGKTTIGRHLAQALGLEFFDLDWYIENRFQMKIPDIFKLKGEDEFRQIERKMLHEVAEFENIVLSCGGGTPCFFDNVQYMNGIADTVYLRAKPEVLQTHLGMGKSIRPLIQGKTPDELHDYIVQSLRQRDPYYSLAKHVIDINVIHTKGQIQEYVNQIIALLP